MNKFISDAKNNINKANVNKQLINLPNYDPNKFPYNYRMKMKGYQSYLNRDERGNVIFNPDNYYQQMANFNTFKASNPNIKPIIQGNLLNTQSKQKGSGYKPIIEDDYNNDLAEEHFRVI